MEATGPRLIPVARDSVRSRSVEACVLAWRVPDEPGGGGFGRGGFSDAPIRPNPVAMDYTALLIRDLEVAMIYNTVH